MDKRRIDAANTNHAARRRGIVPTLVYVFEQVMPDPFVLSIGLTLVVSLVAVAFAPHASLPTILTSWYDGTFNILGFALQMILILATGYAIADAPIVQRGLRAMAAGVPTPARAALTVFPIVAIAAWLNWGAWPDRRRALVSRNRQAREGGFRVARRGQLLCLVGLQ